MEEPLPANFRFPTIQAYSGTTDPREHLNRYRATMLMTRASDAIMCRGFLSTLDGHAQDWCGSLPEGSISTFATLTRRFLSYFAGHMRKKKQFADLCFLKQRSSESLADFLSKWKKESIGVSNFDDKAAIPIFRSNLRSGAFHQDLIRYPPKTYTELMDCASRFADAEVAEKRKKEEEEGKDRKGKGRVWRKGGSSEPSASAPRKRELGQLTDEEERELDNPHPQKKQAIHVIFGGAEGGETPAERKKWARSLYVGEVVRPPHEKRPRREINEVVVHRVLVDTGSSVNVMYHDTFTQLGLSRKQLGQVRTPLSGFTGDSIETEGSINLEVEIGAPPHTKRLEVEFVVVRISCAHNVILGRPALEDLRCIISMEHLRLKFPTPTGVGVARGDQRISRSCYLRACRQIGKRDLQVHTIAEKALKEEEGRPRAEPVVETEEVVLDLSRPDRVVEVGTGLALELRARIIGVIRAYKGVFAWGPEDMPGLSRDVITHKLAVDPTAKPVQQRKRYLSAERREFVRTEVNTLLEIGHVREVLYPKWLANVVLGPKPPTWRICVDYTDLNKACPMDPFPLPNIDQLVDETAGCALMSFLDAFRGYHQIFMHEDDEEKTAFTTPEGVFCYRVMAFGLKNSGATYTRMVAKVFKQVLGHNMEAYVDDMIVKSAEADTHVSDLDEVFSIMQRYDLRLNPKKCTFGVHGGKFLGYMVSKRGIEPNPDKVRAILDMEPPRSLREVQRLNGKLAALGRFLLRSAEKSLPFFAVLKKSSGFEWSLECQKAFDDLKAYMMSLLPLAKPVRGETLYLYLGISQAAISSVLVRDDAGVQRPIYSTSRALRGAKLRYFPTEKAIFAVDVTAKKLNHYFQAHPIQVLTNQPLESVLRASGSASRLVRWSMRLSQYNIQFKPRPAIKGQALADFIVECTAREATEQARSEEEEWWTLSTDGSSSAKGCGGGVVLVTPEGFRAYYALCFHFKLSNNEAEYEALLGGLRLALSMRAEKLNIRCDSRLVVGQVTGEFEANEDRMRRYRDVVLQLLGQLAHHEVLQVPREQNIDADMLSKLGQGTPEHVSKIARVEDLARSSLEAYPVLPVQVRSACWLDHLKVYKELGALPPDEADAKLVQRRAPTYLLIGDTLYKRSYNGTLLRCLYPEEVRAVMEEIHEGTCSAHQGAYTMARKAILQGYFWPRMAKECADYARSYPTCQQFQVGPGRPATNYTPISSVIPFSRWGVDLVGALPMGSGKRKYLIVVAVDYFTKWVEAEPLASITSARCKQFIYKNILFRFGVPMQIITDNRRQFESKEFSEFCAQWRITHTRVAVSYPQANGQVENVNRTIVDGL
ncbi:PREDICTED: uncharacterized protein LOC109191268 [Ipomoea nil]|uniref:uncharacterized protein LOC109191268 n=1 Tax=Ipomoea nil TaxID=35883 RepID=UPI000900ED9E|nr:PREDICTED: uncharacterized protein LOC109191268 [Ipomoea nil]